jgi:putative transposase
MSTTSPFLFRRVNKVVPANGFPIEIVRTPLSGAAGQRRGGALCAHGSDGGLDRLLLLNQQHLEGAVATFVHHYNTHRPHRGLDLRAPQPARPVARSGAASIEVGVQRRDRLGGLIHKYVLAA